MKVRELIDELTRLCDPDAEVHLAYPSGDHWRTELAPKLRRVDEDGLVKHSGYHEEDQTVDAESDDEGDEIREVVILR